MSKKIFIIFLSSLVISGCNTQERSSSHKASRPIYTLIHKEASLAVATGIKGEPFVIDALSGKKQSSCSSFNIENNNQEVSQKPLQSKDKASDCELPVVKPSAELLEAISKTHTSISGTVIKDGKEVSVKFYSVLIAANAGSICSTIFSGGSQYQTCISEQQTCETWREDLDFLSLDEFLLEVPECVGFITQ